MFDRTKRLIRWAMHATAYMNKVPKFMIASTVSFGVFITTLILTRFTHGSMRVGLFVGMVLALLLGFIILKANFFPQTQSGDTEI